MIMEATEELGEGDSFGDNRNDSTIFVAGHCIL